MKEGKDPAHKAGFFCAGEAADEIIKEK